MSENNNHSNSSTDKDTLFMLGGVACIVFGAGPMVRRYLGQVGLGNLVQDVLPDLDRYLKLRSM